MPHPVHPESPDEPTTSDETPPAPGPATEAVCAAGLIAATMALMTAHAAPEPAARLGVALQRQLMARKIVSNLFQLAHHPELPAGLRRVVHGLHARWCAQARGDATPHAPTAALVLH